MSVTKLFMDYIASPTHQWWVENVWKPSWSKAVSLWYGLPSGIVLVLEYVSKLAQDDKISNFLHQMNIPDGVFGVLAGVALIHYLASEHK